MADGAAQGVDPEFKPQYHKKKKWVMIQSLIITDWTIKS
jgi:hypothetical protein